jgi:hypothetical protein
MHACNRTWWGIVLDMTPKRANPDLDFRLKVRPSLARCTDAPILWINFTITNA